MNIVANATKFQQKNFSSIFMLHRVNKMLKLSHRLRSGEWYEVIKRNYQINNEGFNILEQTM